MKTEVEVGVMCLQVKECPGWLAAPEAEEAERRSCNRLRPPALRGHPALPTSWSRTLASRFLREKVSSCACFVMQAWETKTRMSTHQWFKPT